MNNLSRAIEFPAPSLDGNGVKRWAVHFEGMDIIVFDRPEPYRQDGGARYIVRTGNINGQMQETRYYKTISGVRSYLGRTFNVGIVRFSESGQ